MARNSGGGRRRDFLAGGGRRDFSAGGGARFTKTVAGGAVAGGAVAGGAVVGGAVVGGATGGGASPMRARYSGSIGWLGAGERGVS